jgi:hypothetical protein
MFPRVLPAPMPSFGGARAGPQFVLRPEMLLLFLSFPIHVGS